MRRSNLSNQSGVGLIEVLIAVVVLSLGFLAAAKMQVAGMRNSQNAYFLSQANFMLRDMTDRMRANYEGVLANNYSPFITSAGTVEPACITNNSRCGIDQLADADLYAWNSYLYAPTGAVDFKPILPMYDAMPAKGEITYDAVTDVYTISVSWAEQIDGELESQTLSVLLTP